MKLRNLFLASVACAGLFTACSNEMDEVIDNGQEQVQAEAYASFTFAMPASAGTRALTTEDGSSEENNFTKVKIMLFDATGNRTDNFDLDRTKFTPVKTDGAIYYTTKEDLGITKGAGTYSVHVILNPTGSFDKLDKLTDYQAEIEEVAATTGAYCTNNNFLMTNADTKDEVVIDAINKKGNAAKVTVKVERMAAKVTFTPTDKNVYSIEGSNIKVTFDAFKVINTRSNAFGLRRVGDGTAAPTIGGKETLTPANYVIDNIFASKVKTFDKTIFDANYSRRQDTYVAFRKLNATDAQPLAYCLENTMLADNQINGWSTGIIFRGKLNVPAEELKGAVDAKGNLYRYDGKFYATLQDLVKGTDNWDGNDNTNGLTNDVLGIKTKIEGTTVEAYLTSINDRALLHAFGVEFFVGGYSYYTTWLRHQNNGVEGMGIMEFAIVRNNVYQVSISKVNKIGDFTSGTPGPVDPTKPEDGQVDVDPNNPNPEIPGDVADLGEPEEPVVPADPNNPDEATNVYLSVGIKVLPWTVRNNAVEL